MAGKAEGGNARRISAITVPVRSDASGFTKGLAGAKKDAEKFRSSLQKTFGSGLFGTGINDQVERFSAKLKALSNTNIGMLVKGVSGLAAASLAAGTAIATIGFKRITDLGKEAQSIGVTAEALSRLRGVATETKTDFGDLNTFVKSLTSSINDSIGRTTNASQAFAALGTSAEELQKMTPEQQIQALNKGFSKIPSDAEKARIAMLLAGEDGIKVFRLLTLSQEKFQSAFSNAPIVTDDQVEQARTLEASFNKIAEAVVHLAESFATSLAPHINAFAGKAIEYANLVKQAWTDVQDSLIAVGETVGAFYGTHIAPMIDRVSAGVLGFTDGVINKVKELADVFTTYFARRIQQVSDFLVDLTKKFEAITGIQLTDPTKINQVAKLPSSSLPKPATNASANSSANAEPLKNLTSAVGQLAKNASKNLNPEKTGPKSDATKVAEALGAASRMNTGLITAINNLREDYRETIATAGKDEIHRRVDALKGATPEERRELIQRGYQAREAGKTSSLRDELQESTKLPIQKLAEDLARINRMAQLGEANGGLSRSQALRAAAQKTQESGVAGGQVQFAGALQANSIEGRSYLLSQTFGRPQDAVEVARQGLNATLQGNGFLARMVNILSNQQRDAMVSF